MPTLHYCQICGSGNAIFGFFDPYVKREERSIIWSCPAHKAEVERAEIDPTLTRLW